MSWTHERDANATTTEHRPSAWNKGRRRAIVPLLVLAFAVSYPVSAGQPDVEAVGRVHAAIQKAPDSARIEEALVALITEQARLAETNRGYPSGLGLQSPAFQRRLEEGVAKLVDEARGSPQQLDKLLRHLGTQGAVEAIVADYLGFDPPGAYLPESDGKLAKPSLASQITAGSHSPLLELAEARSSVKDEVGGPGAGNGTLDAGEWVKLQLGLDNVGERPLFSSSAYLRVDGGNGWVDSSEEHVLAEMDPMTGRSSITAWVYLSQSCKNGTRIPLVVDVYDTHQAPTTPERLHIDLHLTNVDAPKLTSVVLDTDVPGSSDGSNRLPIEPGQHFEVATDLTVMGARPERVRMAYVPEPLAKDLFDISYRGVPMVAVSGPSSTEHHFVAGDDLDLLAIGEPAFGRALAGHSAAAMRAGNGRTYSLFAVDVELLLPSSDQPEHTPATVPPPPQPLPTAQLVSLVQRHVHLAPRPAATTSATATEATDGYEILFDRTAFGKAYEHLVWPDQAAASDPEVPDPVPYRVRTYLTVPVSFSTPRASCQIALPMDRQGFELGESIRVVGQVLNPPGSTGAGMEVRWTSDTDGLVARTAFSAQGATSGTAVLSAGTHHLVMSALNQGEEICHDEVTVAVRRRSAPTVAEPEPVLDEPIGPRFRLDAGAAMVIAQVSDNDEPAVVFEGDRANLMRLGARITIGRSLRSTWMFQVAPPSGASFAVIEDKLSQVLLGAGVAYGVPLGQTATVEPRLTAGLMFRTLSLEDEPEATTVTHGFIAPGVSFILMSEAGVGLHLSADYELASPWTPWGNLDYVMMKGSGLRPGLGISAAW